MTYPKYSKGIDYIPFETLTHWMAKNTNHQMTLGDLIVELEKLPSDQKIVNFQPYSTEKLEVEKKPIALYSSLDCKNESFVTTVDKVLEMLKTECLNQTYRTDHCIEYLVDNTSVLIYELEKYNGNVEDNVLRIVGLKQIEGTNVISFVTMTEKTSFIDWF